MTQKALVTGGAGFIGSHLCRELLAQGWAVTVLDDFSTGKMENLASVAADIDVIGASVENEPCLARAAEACDVIFHLAAVVSVPQTVAQPVAAAAVNEMGTLKVLQAARQAGARRVVFSSSCAVYGDSDEIPKHEQLDVRPASPYALQKYVGEQYGRLYHELYQLETVSLRYFNVYGPRQDPSSPYSGVISIFMDRAVKKCAPVIYGDGRQYRDFVYVADVVQANLQAARASAAAGQAYNIGTGRPMRIDELWARICKLADIDIPPQFAAARVGDIVESVADPELARRKLDFKAETSVDRGLAQTFDWYVRSLKKIGE